MLGFQYVVYDNGTPAETFYGDDRIKPPAACPFYWGRARLAK